MASKDFTFYLYYVEKHSTPEEPFFSLNGSEGMEAHGYTLIRTVTITQELPDMASLTQQRLAVLDQMEAEARSKFASTIKEIFDRRQSLLAIENTVEA